TASGRAPPRPPSRRRRSPPRARTGGGARRRWRPATARSAPWAGQATGGLPLDDAGDLPPAGPRGEGQVVGHGGGVEPGNGFRGAGRVGEAEVALEVDVARAGQAARCVGGQDEGGVTPGLEQRPLGG